MSPLYFKSQFRFGWVNLRWGTYILER